MEIHFKSSTRTKIIPRFLSSLGPGIVLAAAAVGGSHLVASTKAGAIYGWQLIGLIVLVNFFKYPFFKAGVQYTMGTKKSLVEGYSDLGKGYLFTFMVLSCVGAIVNTAALTMFSASLLSYFLPIDVPLTVGSVLIISVCLIILFSGSFSSLDKLSKLIMATLTIFTVIALILALSKAEPVMIDDYNSPSPWTLSALGFLVVTMGWMPAPIEMSSINSIWLKTQSESKIVTPKAALFDFNVGYIGTTLLAVVFLSLGATLLHGTGVELSKSGIRFSQQLVSLYSHTIGDWSKYLVAMIAFFSIFGSTITVIDGYARAISESQRLLKSEKSYSYKLYGFWMLSISATALYIIVFLAGALIPMLDFAMIMAFTAAPFFAFLNYVLIKKSNLPEPLKLGKGMNILAITGLVYLFGFLILFVWWKWLL